MRHLGSASYGQQAAETGSATAPLPSVGVCIPTYNQVEHLPKAVESAFAQDYRGALEVWVGDDASTDRTPEALEALSDEHPELKVLRQPTNQGIPANSSAVMRKPQTDYIVRLDSDDLMEPQFVSRLVAEMESHPEAGYGHTAVALIDEHDCQGEPRRLIRKSGYQGAEQALRASLSGYRTTANILIFRRRALEALDFYEGRPESGQDYDLSVRMADAGYGNVYIDEILARYREWADAKGVRARRKAARLAGYQQIFEEAFEPAWKRRGWDTRQLDRQRRWLALHNCAACFAPQYTAAEREQLAEMLRRLGDSRRLRLRIAFCRAGGAPLLNRLNTLRYSFKRAVKAIVKRVAQRR
jgi:glycosyltransferase involved in cell wall biosynthesis